MTAGATADASKILQILRGLAQGDVLSLGAVSVVGRGPTAALSAAGVREPDADELWTLAVDSEIGWYVILSGPCDIVRDVSIEPCLVVCPVMLTTAKRHAQLRHGGYSPREFPLPPAKLRAACDTPTGEEFFPVADLRYVTTVDKTALAHPEVRSLRPLTGPQRERLAMWAGRRYARAAHPDAVEENVLKKAARVIAIAAADSVTKESGKRTLQQKLVCATDTWLVTTSELAVTFYPVLTESLAKAAGLFDAGNVRIDLGQTKAAAKALTGELSAAMTTGSGFHVKVAPTTWDDMTASEYLERPQWLWEADPDPLA